MRSWLFTEDQVSQKSDKSHLLSGGAGEDTTLNTGYVSGERAEFYIHNAHLESSSYTKPEVRQH